MSENFTAFCETLAIHGKHVWQIYMAGKNRPRSAFRNVDPNCFEIPPDVCRVAGCKWWRYMLDTNCAHAARLPHFSFFFSKSFAGSLCSEMWLSNSSFENTPFLTLYWFFSAAIECFFTESPCLSSTGFG